MEELKANILQAYRNGKVVYQTFPEEFETALMEEFIKQPASGILYDLNRGEETTLAIIREPGWVNDLAVAHVIRALKDRIEELEKQQK